MRISLLPLFLFLTLSVYSQTLYFPPMTGNNWETESPSVLGWNADSLNALRTFLDANDTKAFIVLHNGRMVTEWYFDSFTADSSWYWASAGKTLTALLAGILQSKGFFSINQKTSDFLGSGWTSLPAAKESLITIRNQLTMTTGLKDDVLDRDCTLPECLQYTADAGNRWAYHNAPYTLLEKVMEQATGKTRNQLTQEYVKAKTGMTGLWFQQGYNNVFFSNARSAARFALLIMNKGLWNVDTVLHDNIYFEEMVNTSQQLNKSYGYLWWLNGKESYMMPQLQFVFNGSAIPTAPADLFAGLGKNDQKIYVIPSKRLCVIRFGNTTGTTPLALSGFDNQLWARIANLSQPSTIDEPSPPDIFKLHQNYPNPFNPTTTIHFDIPQKSGVSLIVYNALGQQVQELVSDDMAPGTYSVDFNGAGLSSGLYFTVLRAGSVTLTRKMVLVK